MILSVKINKNECWYGMESDLGHSQPITKNSFITIDNTIAQHCNQSTPFLISNQGRFIWSENGFTLSAKFGKLVCKSNTAEINIYEGYKDLKGAFLKARDMFFPAQGRMPNELMFKVPQYCTWIEMMTDQRQNRILDYAQSILDCGMPAGELIIDDGWQRDFGEWDFDKNKFINPKEMVKKLKDMGFEVILWICPFVSKNSSSFQYLKDNNCLVKDSSDSIAERVWWNGQHPVLDLSNPKALEWFKNQADFLMDTYGIAGFKQDAGDSVYYKQDDKTFGNVTPNEQSLLWHNSAIEYDFNELRACWKGGGSGVAQRLGDKNHSWNALRKLIPNSLVQGICGYSYICPDMIGGGLSADFYPGKPQDNELFIRSAQCSALMPMMQYSLAIWKIKADNVAAMAIKACDLHTQYSEYILQLAKNAKTTCEPIIRFMEYDFPNQNLHKAKQQFMLGNKYLIAPIVWKGKYFRKVMLPKGNWKFNDKVYTGGKTVKIKADIEQLIILEKI